MENKAKAKAEKAAAKAIAKEKAEEERAAEKAKVKEEKKQVKSLQLMAEKKLLEDIKLSVDTNARSATFACGGNVYLKTSVASDGQKDDEGAHKTSTSETDPIQIRFGESEAGITLILPTASAAWTELQALIDACQPASFGRGGEEVLDEDYRKAGKLDKTGFTTSFCPYEVGIIDVVAQLLLPQTQQDEHLRSI